MVPVLYSNSNSNSNSNIAIVLRVVVSTSMPNQDSQAYPAELCSAVAALVQELQGAREPRRVATGIQTFFKSRRPSRKEEEEEVALY